MNIFELFEIDNEIFVAIYKDDYNTKELATDIKLNQEIGDLLFSKYPVLGAFSFEIDDSNPNILLKKVISMEFNFKNII